MMSYAMENLPREITCTYSANSPYLQCAVNPMGNCSECCHYAARQISASIVVIQATARTGKSVLMWEIMETAWQIS